MPKAPEVSYYPTRKAYFTCYKGKQHRLASGPDDKPGGPTYLAALKAFSQLMATGNIEKAGDSNQVQVILEKYLQHAEGKLSSSTLTRRVYCLQPFVTACGSLPVSELSHFRVDEFIDEQRKPRKKGSFTYSWGDSSIATFLEAANCAFNWARKRKLITANPLEGYEGPKARSRSEECLIGPEEHQLILSRCRSKAMRRIIIALHGSGARPSELRLAKVRDWDASLDAIVYHKDDRRRTDEFRHKNAKHKERVIVFTGAALEMVRELVKSRPADSPIFPNSRGKHYGRTSIGSYFENQQKRLNLPHLIAYGYRHTLATAWLKAGQPVEYLAELLGNTPQTIYRYYSHLCKDRAAIRKRLEDFMKVRENGTSSSCPDDRVSASAQSA